MRTRKLGQTGIDVSELGLGTWGLSGDGYGPVSESEQDAVIERALAFGVTLFDTADTYGRGAMEKRLGERLPKDDPTLTVVTKWGTDLTTRPTRKRFDLAYLTEARDRSLERLGRERIDVGLLHNPSSKALENSELAEQMQQWVDEGKLRAWGISAGSPELVKLALALPKPPQVIEIAFNVFLRQDLIELGASLQSQGVGVLARSVLAHGLLAGYWPTDKTFPPEDHRARRWSRDQLKRRVTQLRALRALYSAALPGMRSAAVAFVLHQEAISCAVLGPRNTLQLDQLIREIPKQPPYLDERAEKLLETQLGQLRVGA